MTKILIIRFSSIGDIVLTTPVIRCLKTQLPGINLQYASKKTFQGILENNPYIDKLHLFEDDLNLLIKNLKAENFDFIVDLHNNLRTRIIKSRLGVPSFSFKKLNVKKFIYTKFKINYLPKVHIVERYLDTVKFFKVENDGKGLDYFIPKEDEIDISNIKIEPNYIGFVIGAKFATKRMPKEKILEVCRQLKDPVVFLGGPEDKTLGDELCSILDDRNFYNACGKFNLNQSASLVKQASKVITHDTGLMHIASAFQKDIISVWGNTTTSLGMFPYVVEKKYKVIEVKDLDCRPCSKIGYKECPKGHFKCMNLIDTKVIINALK